MFDFFSVIKICYKYVDVVLSQPGERGHLFYGFECGEIET